MPSHQSTPRDLALIEGRYSAAVSVSETARAPRARRDPRFVQYFDTFTPCRLDEGVHLLSRLRPKADVDVPMGCTGVAHWAQPKAREVHSHAMDILKAHDRPTTKGRENPLVERLTGSGVHTGWTRGRARPTLGGPEASFRR